MTDFDVLVLSLGTETPERVDTSRALYERLVALYVADQANVVGGRSLSQTWPIPLQELQQSDGGKAVSKSLRDAVQLVPPAATVLVIELREPVNHLVPGVVYERIADSILAWLDDWGRQGLQRKLIVVAPAIPPNWSEVFRPMKADGRIVLLSLADLARQMGTDGPEAQAAEVLFSHEMSPLEKLKMCLIRHYGLFEIRGEASVERVGCIYDARYAIPALRDLLRSYLESQATEAGNLFVIVGPSLEVNPWLREAALPAATDLSLDYHIFGVDSRSLKEHLAESEPKRVSVLLPYLDRGDGLRAVLRELPAELSVSALAVLSSVGSVEERGHIPVDSGTSRGSVTVEYFLRRPRPRVEDDGLLEPDILPSISSMLGPLSSREFWTAVRRVGVLSKETNVPRGRKALTPVPNFERLVAEDRAWIAFRLARLIGVETQKRLAEVIVVVPDEPERSASAGLASFLREILGVSVVPVPRSIIDAAATVSSLEELSQDQRGAFTEWWHPLRTARHRDNVVIVDEFELTGGTTNGLIELLSLLDISPLGVFVVLDLSPHARREVSRKSLYAWRSLAPALVGSP